MAGKRSRDLCSQVQKKVDRHEDYVYKELNEVQLEICERAFCLEYKFSIAVVAGTELYDFPDGFVVDRVVQPNSSNGIMEVNLEELTNIKVAESSSTSAVTYFYKINGQIGFMTADGSAPTANETIYIYAWRRPKDDKTEDIAKDIDPILDRRWNRCLVLGAIARLVDEPKQQVFYEGLFDKEFQKINLVESSIDNNMWTISATQEYD